MFFRSYASWPPTGGKRGRKPYQLGPDFVILVVNGIVFIGRLMIQTHVYFLTLQWGRERVTLTNYAGKLYGVFVLG